MTPRFISIFGSNNQKLLEAPWVPQFNGWEPAAANAHCHMRGWGWNLLTLGEGMGCCGGKDRCVSVNSWLLMSMFSAI